ncbi:unnamed protein product, partial [Polarella glacialis]
KPTVTPAMSLSIASLRASPLRFSSRFVSGLNSLGTRGGGGCQFCASFSSSAEPSDCGDASSSSSRRRRRWAPGSEEAEGERKRTLRYAQLPFCGPSTTYEGNDDNDGSWLRKLNSCAGSFVRGTFVKQGLSGEDLARKYDIGEELGSGATATVYRAVNRRTGHAVAMKAISKTHISDHQMLQNEIQIHKATDHPNILRLLEIFEDETQLMLVCELCGAGDLWKLLISNQDEFAGSQLCEEDAMQIFKQILNSVVYLHSRGIVHRDLKPGNFLCQKVPEPTGSSSKTESRVGIIKLADFGVSSYCHVKHRLTRRVGTDGFMAPEVARNQPYDEKADCFSCGCILHMLLTGHPPKQREDGSYTISKIRLNFVSPEARSLVQQLMAPLPEDRPSAEQALRSPLLQGSRQRLRAGSARLD